MPTLPLQWDMSSCPVSNFEWWRLQSYWANYCTKSDVSQQLRSADLNSSHHNSGSNPPLWLLLAGEHLNIVNPAGISSLCSHSVRLSGASCPDPGTTFLWARITRWPLQASPGRKIVLKRPGSVNKIAVIEMKLVRKRMKALICG